MYIHIQKIDLLMVFSLRININIYYNNKYEYGN